VTRQDASRTSAQVRTGGNERGRARATREHQKGSPATSLLTTRDSLVTLLPEEPPSLAWFPLRILVGKLAVNRATGGPRVGTRSAWLGRVNDDPLVKRRPARPPDAALVVSAGDPPLNTHASRSMREASGHQVHEDLLCDVRHLVAMVSS